MNRTPFLLLASFFSSLAWAQPTFRIENQRVQILSGAELIAQPPAEGLWSLSCDWRDNWPANWQHARPARHVKLSVRFEATADSAQPLLPGIN